MKKQWACLLVLLSLAQARLVAIAFDPFLSPSPLCGEGQASFYFTNDAFGPGPVVEWDDLDSFGFRGRACLPGFALGLAYSALTDRNEDQAASSRMDRLALGLTRDFRLFPRGSFLIELSISGGLLAHGNFAGLALQQGFHAQVAGVGRAVPETYKQGDRAEPFAAFTLEASLEGQVSPSLGLGGSYALGGGSSLLALAGLSYHGWNSFLFLGCGGRLSTPEQNMPVEKALAAAETGLSLSGEVCVGLLSTRFEASPITGHSNGELGISFSGPQRSGRGLPGPELELDAGIRLDTAASPGMRLTVWLPSNAEARQGLYAGWRNGWWGGKPSGGAEGERFSDYVAGCILDLATPGGLLHAAVGGGFRLSFEEVRAMTMTVSELLGRRTVIAADLSAELKVALLPIHAPRTGLGIRGRWSPFEARLFSRGEEAAEGDGLALELFVFSQ